jgi:hypothetical protein
MQRSSKGDAGGRADDGQRRSRERVGRRTSAVEVKMAAAHLRSSSGKALASVGRGASWVEARRRQTAPLVSDAMAQRWL